MVQCRFQAQYHKDPPTDKPIRTWYNNFELTGSLSAGKQKGRPSVSDVDIEPVREAFTQSLQKSTQSTRKELQIPQKTVWHIVCKRLQFKPFVIQLLQALSPQHHYLCRQFCIHFQEGLEEYSEKLISSDEATFHVSGKVNHHNVTIWGTDNLHVSVEHVRDSPKVSVVSSMKVYGLFFFAEHTVTGPVDMLQQWLIPQLQEDR